MKKLFKYNEFLLNEQLIVEGRIDTLKKKYNDIIGKEVTDWIISEDPTHNKAYIEWVLKKYSNMLDEHKNQLEQLKKPIYKTVMSFIEKYHQIRKNVDNITNIPSIISLIDIVSNYEKDWDDLKDYDVDIYVENDEWIIFVPKEFEASEKFGHNNPNKGSSWCVCYDISYFYQYFCPDGGIMMIINKIDETKNIALELKKSGQILLWDYDDKTQEFFNIDEQSVLISYLKKEKDYDFIIDYFENNPLKLVDLPNIDLEYVKDEWIRMNGDLWESYISVNNYATFFNWDEYQDYIIDDIINNNYEKYIDDINLVDYINKKDIDENIDLEGNRLEYMSFDELKEIIEKYDNWNDFLNDFVENNVDRNYLEEIVDEDSYSYGFYDFENFLDIEKFMKDIVEDLDGNILIQEYYENQ